MDLTALQKVTDELTVALTKLVQVLQDASTTQIHSNNQSEQSALAPTAPSGVELDADNCPWDARINTANKTQTAKKIWKRRPGLGDGVYEEIKKEIRVEVAAPDTTQAAPSAPPVPGAPTVPSAPTVPGVPAGNAPDMDQVSAEAVKAKEEAVALIKELTDFGLTMADCKEIVAEEFKVRQDGDIVIFGGLTYEQYHQVRDFFAGLRDTYYEVRDLIAHVKELAGDAQAATVSQGLAILYKQQNTEELSGVHYSNIDAFKRQVADWHQQWVDWANS